MTTAASARIRRSVRFAQFEMQSEPLKAEAAPRRQRITVADHLETRSFQNTQDWTGGLGISPSGRFRVVEGNGKGQVILSRNGIRKDWAKFVLIFLAAVMTAVLLAETAAFGAGKIRIRKLNQSIEKMESRNQTLQDTLERTGGDVSVCTEAVKLNLVSSNGVRPITLTAPSGARMVLMENTAQGTSELRASALPAGTQGD